jgi:hypothetical protein
VEGIYQPKGYRELTFMAEKSYNPADKFSWKEGDIEILKPGTGEPLLSEEELDRIIRENRSPADCRRMMNSDAPIPREPGSEIPAKPK